MPRPATPAVTDRERNVPGITPALRARLRWLFRVLGALSTTLAAHVALHLFTTPRRRPVDARELAFLATARQRTLATSRGTIQCYEWPAAGPRVLVVHGWISHAARLADVIRALHAQGLHVVAFDAPAHGRSSGQRADIRAFQAALAAAESTYGPLAGVLAHSFGALSTAAWLAGDAQPPDPALPAAARVLPRMRAAVLVGMPRDVNYLLESFSSVAALDTRIVARMRALMHARYGAWPEQFSARELATHIRIPVLLVHGGADEFVPTAHSAEVAESLVNGSVQVVEDLRHSAPLRDPQCLAQMAGFLLARLGDPPPG